MPDFTSLPEELLQLIFKYLTQEECCEIMRVCRHFYKTIPVCTTKIWNHLDVYDARWELPNHCMVKCLGPHVNDVFIGTTKSCVTNSCEVLVKLAKTQCSIKTLGMNILIFLLLHTVN